MHFHIEPVYQIGTACAWFTKLYSRVSDRRRGSYLPGSCTRKPWWEILSKRLDGGIQTVCSFFRSRLLFFYILEYMYFSIFCRYIRILKCCNIFCVYSKNIPEYTLNIPDQSIALYSKVYSVGIPKYTIFWDGIFYILKIYHVLWEYSIFSSLYPHTKIYFRI